MSPAPDTKTEEEGRVGLFPSWRWVYGTVLGYGILLIIILTLLSRLLDFGVGS